MYMYTIRPPQLHIYDQDVSSPSNDITKCCPENISKLMSSNSAHQHPTYFWTAIPFHGGLPISSPNWWHHFKQSLIHPNLQASRFSFVQMLCAVSLFINRFPLPYISIHFQTNSSSSSNKSQPRTSSLTQLIVYVDLHVFWFGYFHQLKFCLLHRPRSWMHDLHQKPAPGHQDQQIRDALMMEPSGYMQGFVLQSGK